MLQAAAFMISGMDTPAALAQDAATPLVSWALMFIARRSSKGRSRYVPAMASLTHPAIVSFAAFEWGSFEEMKRAFSWPLMVLVLSKYHLRALIGQCNLSSGEWSDRAAIKTGSGVKCADWFLSSMREDKNVNPPDSLRRYAGSMRHAWIQPPLRPDASCMRKAVLTERFRKEALAIGSKGACDRCPRTLGRSQTGFNCLVVALELKIPFMTDWRTG